VIRRKDTSPGQDPPRRRLPAARRRDLVIEAATKAFAEHGYEGASITRIAEQAGIVASVVYDHFGSKRELYLELLAGHAQTLIEHTTRASPSGSPQELFDSNLAAFYRFVETHPFIWRMIFRDPPADAMIAAAQREIQRRASEAIAALVGSVRPGEQLIAGVPRAQTNAMLAEGITAINNGLAAWWYEHREVPREQVLATARVLLWTGLQHLANSPGNDGPLGST
jgi:AcrR family transcriptional regulator